MTARFIFAGFEVSRIKPAVIDRRYRNPADKCRNAIDILYNKL
jgi:hypothetical protein